MAWTLVTGGAKGLGAEICRFLSSRGYPVIVHYRASEKDAQSVLKECLDNGGKAVALQADLSTPEGVRGLLDKILGKSFEIENLVNNVGNFFKGTPMQTPMDAWFELFQTNLHAPYALIRGLMPQIKSCRGSVINIGTAGVQDMRADAKYTAYTITKKSLYMLTKALAKELAPHNVRVNMVSPGELENSVTLPDDPTVLPMGRAATLQEVADVVYFLLQKEAGYITGQNIEVAGGFTL